MNRFQMLRGENPPVKKKVAVPKPHYFYGVDYGTKRNNTAVAICHEKQGIIFLDFHGLLENSSYATLDEWLHKLEIQFPVFRLTMDTGLSYQGDFSGLGYQRTRCTRDMHSVMKTSILENRFGMFVRYGSLSRDTSDHVIDALALAYDSIMKENPIPYDINFIHGTQHSQ